MANYQLLIFQNSRLVRAERLEADGYVEAIQAASAQEPGQHVEVWSDGRRLGVIGPSYRPHDSYFRRGV
jgi:hypothetical protein